LELLATTDRREFRRLKILSARQLADASQASTVKAHGAGHTKQLVKPWLDEVTG
jgi:hypothetical protein